MIIEWWEARGSTVLHAREVVNGKLNGAALCSRQVIWLREMTISPLISRCGYCTYNVKSGGKA